MKEWGDGRFAAAAGDGADDRFRRIVDAAPLLVARYDLRGHLIYVNDSLEGVDAPAIFDVGLSPPPGGVSPLDGRLKLMAALRRVLDSGENECLELQVRRRQGEGMLLRVTVAAERDVSGQRTGAIVYGVDVSEVASYRDQLDSLAFRDVLTGLANRHAFRQQLQSVLVAHAREPGMLAVFMMDIDRFRAVNASLGHPLGDLMLEKVANRLKTCVRGTATIARLGGDEFAVLLRAVKEIADLEAVARKILALFDTPFLIGKWEIVSSVSIGISMAAPGGHRADDLLKLAEIAMYRAKQGGGRAFRVYSDSTGD